MKNTELYKRQFKAYLRHIGYSSSSVYMLPECVKDFLQYHNNIDPQAVTRQHIETFYNWLQIRPHKRTGASLSEQYIYHHIYALKVFFSSLEELGQIRQNPMSTMKFKRPIHTARQPLTTEEINLLFATAQTAKERAILHIFYSCGLRRSEAVNLNVKDIHFKTGLLYVREGKGRKRRTIPLTAKVCEELLWYWTEERSNPHIQVKTPEAFIVNKKGSRMSGCHYNKIVKALAEKSGLTRPCTLHYLRHSIATHLLENGLSIENVRDFLGHSYLESTQIYTKIKKIKLNYETKISNI